MPHLTALVTLLAAALYFATGIVVARARRSTGVEVPATTGHPDFERAYRIQMNTLEWAPIFLPSLWLAAFYVGDRYAAALGLAWIVGRIAYIAGYLQSAPRRAPGFAIQAFATIALWGASLWAVVGVLMRG